MSKDFGLVLDMFLHSDCGRRWETPLLAVLTAPINPVSVMKSW